MQSWIGQLLITVMVSIFGSVGFWSYLQFRKEKKMDSEKDSSDETKLIVGLAHEKIVELGTRYLERGYITTYEYKSLNDYLYKPYKNLGGDGGAEHIMELVEKLPIKTMSEQAHAPSDTH